MLRTKQTESYWTTPTKESLFREAFGLPNEETILAEVHAVLSLQGKPEAYVSARRAGRLANMMLRR